MREDVLNSYAVSLVWQGAVTPPEAYTLYQAILKSRSKINYQIVTSTNENKIFTYGTTNRFQILLGLFGFDQKYVC